MRRHTYRKTLSFNSVPIIEHSEGRSREGVVEYKMADVKVTLELQEKVLTDNRDFIIKHLDADDVINQLIQAQLIGKNAAQQVELVMMSRVDKNRIICEQLSIAGPGALERFCDIIKKESRQAFITEQLEKCGGV